MKKYYAYSIALLATITTLSIKPCVITITNDTSNPIKIEDKTETNQEKAQHLVEPKKTIKFGRSDMHAKFIILEKNKNDEYQEKYEVDQHTCPVNNAKALELSVSDLIGKTYVDERFFSISRIPRQTEQISLKASYEHRND